MTRFKTSIYIDKDLWARFKSRAHRGGLEVSGLLEGLIGEEMVNELIEQKLSEMAGSEFQEIDFLPVKTEGSVSEMVRFMRDGRKSGLSRQ